jgi:hypothetical protein
MNVVRQPPSALRLLAALGLGTTLAFAYSAGPPDGKAGRPGEGTCLECHSGAGSADSTDLDGLVGGWYQPDSLYSLTLSARYAGQLRWGFELTVVDDSGNAAGQLIVTDSVNTQYSSVAPGYLKQTTAGTFAGTSGPAFWTFQWRAPAAGAGPVRFYWCANAADNNGSTSGDRICRDSLVLTETGVAEPGTVTGRRFWRYANPARNSAVINYRGSAAVPVRIYASSGRLVRSLAPQRNGELLRVVWDGRDQNGEIVPEAGYFIRLGEGLESVASVRLVR